MQEIKLPAIHRPVTGTIGNAKIDYFDSVICYHSFVIDYTSITFAASQLSISKYDPKEKQTLVGSELLNKYGISHSAIPLFPFKCGGAISLSDTTLYFGATAMVLAAFIVLSNSSSTPIRLMIFGVKDNDKCIEFLRSDVDDMLDRIQLGMIMVFVPHPKQIFIKKFSIATHIDFIFGAMDYFKNLVTIAPSPDVQSDNGSETSSVGKRKKI